MLEAREFAVQHVLPWQRHHLHGRRRGPPRGAPRSRPRGSGSSGGSSGGRCIVVVSSEEEVLDAPHVVHCTLDEALDEDGSDFRLLACHEEEERYELHDHADQPLQRRLLLLHAVWRRWRGLPAICDGRRHPRSVLPTVRHSALIVRSGTGRYDGTILDHPGTQFRYLAFLQSPSKAPTFAPRRN